MKLNIHLQRKGAQVVHTQLMAQKYIALFIAFKIFKISLLYAS